MPIVAPGGGRRDLFASQRLGADGVGRGDRNAGGRCFILVVDGSAWWRAQYSRDQPGREITVSLPPIEYDPRAPDAESYVSRTVIVPRQDVAGLWWSPISVGNVREAGQTLARRALRNLEGALADEYGGPRGSVMPVPGMKDTRREAMISTYRALDGGMRPVKSSQVESSQLGTRMTQDWDAKADRCGPTDGDGGGCAKSPQSGIAKLRGAYLVVSGRDVGRARGLAVLHSKRGAATVAGIRGRNVAGARTVVRFSWAELESAEVQSKARAFKAFTDGGLTPAQAAKAAGVEL